MTLVKHPRKEINMNALKASCVRGMLIVVTIVFTLVVSGGCTSGKTKTDNGDGGDGGKGKKKRDYVLYATKDEDFHLRLKIDAAKKEAQAALYDGDNKEVAPIDATELTLNIVNGKAVQITLKAQPVKGDPKGKSSIFVGSGDHLAKSIDHKKAEVTATIAGKQRIFKLDADH
jgi:hypothetical protein